MRRLSTTRDGGEDARTFASKARRLWLRLAVPRLFFSTRSVWPRPGRAGPVGNGPGSCPPGVLDFEEVGFGPQQVAEPGAVTAPSESARLPSTLSRRPWRCRTGAGWISASSRRRRVHFDGTARRMSRSVPWGRRWCSADFTGSRRFRPGTASHTSPPSARVKVRYWSERTTIWFAVRLRPRRQCLRIIRDRYGSPAQRSCFSFA